MDPYVSWGCVIAIGLGLWWYYYQRHQGNKTKPRNSSLLSRKPNTDPVSKRDERKSKTRKEKPQTAPSPNVSDQGNTASQTIPNDRSIKSEDVEGLSNLEFAQQLSNAKTGTMLNRPKQDGPNKRTQRANKEAERLLIRDTSGPSSSQDISTNSSTTGADADDDLSPAASPSLIALPNGRSVVASGDVSDMLEAPSAGPSVLRLTGATEQTRTKQTQSKPFQVQESKKQRSARRKNEARKAERDEAEKERRILLERQLRTAREAEGRPPKNGTASSASKESVWKSQGDTTVKPDASRLDVVRNTPAFPIVSENYKNPTLLDTFDAQNGNKKSRESLKAPQEEKMDAAGATLPLPTGPASDKRNGHVQPEMSTHQNVAQAVDQPKQSWADDLPSEDEQLRMINAMNSDDGWNTVGKRTKKKIPTPTITDGVTSNGNSDIGSVSVQSPNMSSTVVSFQAKEKSTTTNIGDETKASRASYKPHPLDSDWAVV